MFDSLKNLFSTPEDEVNFPVPTREEYQAARDRLRRNQGRKGRQADAEITFDLDIVQRYEEAR